MGVNVRGTFLCYKYAARQMIKQGRGGRIVGAASVAGKKGSDPRYKHSPRTAFGVTACRDFYRSGQWSDLQCEQVCCPRLDAECW